LEAGSEGFSVVEDLFKFSIDLLGGCIGVDRLSFVVLISKLGEEGINPLLVLQAPKKLFVVKVVSAESRPIVAVNFWGRGSLEGSREWFGQVRALKSFWVASLRLFFRVFGLFFSFVFGWLGGL
jgi:hypothetical protein